MPHNVLFKTGGELLNPALGPWYTITGFSSIDGTVTLATRVHRWALEAGLAVKITDDTIVSGELCNVSGEGFCQDCVPWQCSNVPTTTPTETPTTTQTETPTETLTETLTASCNFEATVDCIDILPDT